MITWIVDSDIFAEFSQSCGAIQASDLCTRLANSEVGKDDVFLPGQGLSEADIAELESKAFHSGHVTPFDLWRRHALPKRAPRSLPNKHRVENSLISTPEPHSNDSYQSHLLIAASNEIISDHVTGQHVQGMVLIEACRQMFIAVSELCHMADPEGRKSYVVFNTMEIVFKAFTFPVPALINYKQISVLSPRPDRTAVTAMSVVQNGVTTTSIGVSYTLFRPEQLRKKEVELGIAAVVAYSEMARIESHSPVVVERT